MTLTIDISDEVAAGAVAAGFTPALFQEIATKSAQAGAAAGIHAAVSATAPRSSTERRSLMEFEGVGKGQPGAVSGDVTAYVRSLRDDEDDAGSRG